MKTAIVYDVHSPIAALVASDLEEKGWNVIRECFGEENFTECEAADMLVVNADVFSAPEDDDFDKIGQFVTERIFGLHKLIESCVPALRKGGLKRIAVITENQSSIRLCKSTQNYAKHMLLTGINLKLKMLFNKYRQEDFTIRCYAISSEEAAQGMWKRGEGIEPVDYICMNFSYEAEDAPMHSEENHFVMRNKWFEEVEW